MRLENESPLPPTSGLQTARSWRCMLNIILKRVCNRSGCLLGSEGAPIASFLAFDLIRFSEPRN